MTDARTAERPLIDTERILAPIPGDLPAGEDIRYEPEFDALAEARRMDDDTDKGIWQTDDVKRADWKGVVVGATELLASRSKDLQVAVWLVQALVQQHGPAAIAPGLSMLTGLVDAFWDGLYPRIDEDGDTEARLAPLLWLDERLSRDLLALPIALPEPGAKSGLRLQDWQNAQRLRKLAGRDARAYKAAIAEGEVPVERIVKDVEKTPSDFYVAQRDSLKAAEAAAHALGAALDRLAGRNAPALSRIKRTVEELCRFQEDVLRKRGVTLEPTASVAAPEAASEAAGTGDAATTPGAAAHPAGAAWTGGPRNREEAYGMLRQIADYLEQEEPHSPTSYLVRRAASWGQLSLPELYADLLGDRGEVGRMFSVLRLKDE
ncbi:impA domain protein (plasmid) [Azospirillum sp. B510]|uniref:type VI secretion system protein TssA n=1 Tax=Azospirillum sp. (strain B510) TaxID=137722 RepID=UPI0001C4B8E9|nr:type VI secretion system protein TssA [Azospirillum sp. B510]BAI73689.1 impA domain protein [Azospirillum sp. B510]